ASIIVWSFPRTRPRACKSVISCWATSSVTWWSVRCSMNKAVFLDRDGVINRKAPEDDYVVKWDQFHLLPGVIEAIRNLNQAAYRVIVVTNQRAIAKNRITISELESIHRKLMEKLGEHSATIDGIYFCPHDLESECGCRKPKPGMLLRALDDFAIDPQLSWMVGDS